VRHETSAAASRPPPGPAPTALLPSPSRVPPCRSPGCLATPIVSGREDVSFEATGPLPQDPGSYPALMAAPSPRRTKIVATIGPASSSAERLHELVEAGMDAARL